MTTLVRHKSSFHRRGAAYVFFVSTALLVTIIGVSAITLSRVNFLAAEGLNNRAEARLYAQSAIESALLSLYTDSNWRSTYTNDIWTTRQAIGEGSFSFKLVDQVNGDLMADKSAPVRVYGAGLAGASAWVQSVLVEPPDGAPTGNLAVNGDIESGSVAPWTARDGCTLQLDTSVKHAGAAAILATARTAGSSAQQSLSGLRCGATCSASVWIRTKAATPVSGWIYVWVQNDAGWRSFQLAKKQVGMSWTELKGSATLQCSCVPKGVVLVIGTDASADFYLDDASVIAAPGRAGPIPGTARRETRQ